MIDDTFLLKSYRGAARFLGPLLPLWIKRRAAKGKEDPARLSERRGIATQPRPSGPLVWMHGASVGECSLLLPVIDRLRGERGDISILVTSATRTAADLMESRLPARCIHQYVPLDRPEYVTAFLDYWRPNTAIWAESEIWPNLIRGCKDRGTKTALINARLSARSVAGWSKRPASAKAVFGVFDLILAANQETACAIGDWTGQAINMAGNLKQAAPPLPFDAAALGGLMQGFSGRPIWCAASTHKGEDQIVLDAHKTVQEIHSNTALILAPRHPERAADILALINAAGLSAVQRSKGGIPGADTDIYLFDTIGEMGLAYRLSRITLMCGSLREGLSGHNPLEPAALESAVLSGRHVASFGQSYEALTAEGGAKLIQNPAALGTEISALLSDEAARQGMINAARRVLANQDDVLKITWSGLVPLLPEAAL